MKLSRRVPEAAAGSPESSPAVRRRNRRRAAIGAVVGLVVIVAVLALIVPSWLGGSNKDQKTVWQTITAGITDQGVPKDTALEAFAYLYKVKIPGVTVPSGVDGGDAPTSGSGALRWVRANWDSLTPDQQAVVTGVMTPGPNDVVLTVDATVGAPNSSSGVGPGSGLPSATTAGLPLARLARDAGGPVFAYDAAPRPAESGRPSGDSASSALVDAIKAELIADVQHLGPRLGIPVISEGFSLWKNITLDVSDKSGGGTLMNSFAVENGVGHFNPCSVVVWKEAWQNENTTLSPTFHVLMTHEVIHCYQHVIEGDVATAEGIPAWISEGTALYLAADDTKVAEPMLPSMWQKGYFEPERALTNRSYDAFGYYSLLAHVGRDLWGSMKAAWTAASTNPQRSNAFIAVLAGDDVDVRNMWASSYLRQDGWGDAWVTPGFGLPDSVQVFRHPVAASKSGFEGELLSRANTVLEVGSSEGEIVLVGTAGLASAHDENGVSAMDFQSRTFCVAESCKCPAGTLRAGEEAADQKIGLPFVLAVNAPQGGTKFVVASKTLEEVCGKQPTPAPTGGEPQPAGPCAARGCGNSNGDPHLTTVNAYRYDFQAAGEFTLLRSADGALEIQSRQEPYAGDVSVGGNKPQISTNTAIAARVNGHKVSVYTTGGALAVHVDGAAVDAGSPIDLGDGARIAPYPKGYEIDFPDGTKLWTLSVGSWGINAQVKPSASLKATGAGLIGPVIPGGLGVPALPDGTRLPAAADKHARHDTIYGRYADAWRVTDSTSLFDYQQGKTTASYKIPGFPAETADIVYANLTPEQTAAGQQACAAISDTDLRRDCVFDVAASGQTGFADSYTAVTSLYDGGLATASPSPISAATPTQAPGPSGAFAVAPVTGLGGYVLGPDGKLYVSVGTGKDTAAILEVDAATGKTLAQVAEPYTTRIHLAAGSVWAEGVKQDANLNNCNVTRYDAQTLAEQATIDIPCTFIGGPRVISDGEAVWFVDVSKYDGTTGKGAVLTRIDPATNQPGTSVEIPYPNGYAFDGQGALYYFDTGSDKNMYVLTAGSSTLVSLGAYRFGHFGGGGVWVGSNDQKTAEFYTSDGGPAVTLQIDGSVVGGDDKAVYVEVTSNEGTQLWRYPADGSTPTQLSAAPTILGEEAGYFADPQPISAFGGFVKLWLPSNTDPRTLYEQWVALP